MSDKLQHKCNSISAVEEYLSTLHPDKEISVIESRQYYYVEDPGAGGFIRVWESLLYEGPAKKFKDRE
jgi:hypothetical protein